MAYEKTMKKEKYYEEKPSEMFEYFKKGTMPNACYGPLEEQEVFDHDNDDEMVTSTGRKK